MQGVEGNHLPISATALAKAALRECARLVPEDDAAGRELARALRTAADRLDEPMRLAVVGQIKRGKSTLVNAMLGAEVVATARRELTFNVNELHHANVERIVLHFRDGRPPAVLPPGELARWSDHDPGRLAELRAIRKIEYGLDHDLLRRFRLVDTPGLGSVHADDSAATLAHLGIDDHAERDRLQPMLDLIRRDAPAVHRESAAELDRADAVLYLFSRGLHEQDRRTLAAFSGAATPADSGPGDPEPVGLTVSGDGLASGGRGRAGPADADGRGDRVVPGEPWGPGPGARGGWRDVGGESLTPLKAFGVLTKCDDDWPPDPDIRPDADPLTHHPVEAARRRAETYLDEPGIGRVFYAIVPVAARVAAGAAWLDGDRFGMLAELAALDPRRLAEGLTDEAEFAADPTGPVPPQARRALVDRLGPWGVHLACQALREGLGEEQVRAHLVEQSGVAGLRRLALRHFGNRSMLIKLNQAVRTVRGALARYREDIGPDPRRRAVAEQIGRRVERLERSEHRFAELEALSAYYRGRLTGLSEDEIRQLLEVTGERGTHCAARLALPPDASLTDMAHAVQERIRYWAVRSNDPILDRHGRRVARTIRRSYDGIAERVRLAQRFLEMAD
ncbi:MAG TPA: dynamin family protein [Thermomonospora sp.]|nr:dynamin family protein [Thermomonospora sp.]